MTSTEQLLSQILSSLNKPPLGFHDGAGVIYVYCNRKHGFNWYTLDPNRNPCAISHSSLTGYIKDLKFDKVERRGQETHKLHVTIQADKTYILETGYDSHFSKGLLAAIATLTPEQISEPATIQPQAGDEENVLFSRLWVGNELIKAHYDGETIWREVAQNAVAIVKTANKSSS